ncbi:MAG: nucleotide sugar dehydrogenase [Halobacteria archaeon]
MDISIIGSGYVGTTVAACLSELGHDVVNVDVDESVVETINRGEAPIHEDGLDGLIEKNAGDRLRATTDYGEVKETELTFLCLPTPSRTDGNIDLNILTDAVKSLGEILSDKDGFHYVVTKSTVAPTTVEDVVAPTLEEYSGTKRGESFSVAMNPEFLREGSAVADFLEPDKIVIGASNEDTAKTVREVYRPVLDSTDAALVETGLREAEMIKYANNGFLAAKVSLVNDIGNVCKEFGIDGYEVMDAVGLDDRISERFLRSGLGWGGSCFPKDVDALRRFAADEGYSPRMLEAAVDVNELQPERMVELLKKHVTLDGDVEVGVLGLSFKPGTDDVRNSRALDVIQSLLAEEVEVHAYDPVAVENTREIFPQIEYYCSAEEAVEGCDAALITTEWPEFENLGFEGMESKILIDGRRIDVDRTRLEVYEGLCW